MGKGWTMRGHKAKGFVSLAVLLSMAAQAGTVVWWASAKERDAVFLTQRVDRLEEDVAREASRQEVVLQQLARIEERISSQTRILERIEKGSSVSYH